MDNEIRILTEIQKAEIHDCIFYLCLKITCKYNPAVHSPKVTVIFESGDRTRYLPVPVQSYYQNNDLETCTVIAEYNYNLESVFFKPIEDEAVKVKVGFMYGENFEEETRLVMRGDVFLDEEYELVIDSEHSDGADGSCLLYLKRAKPYEPTHENIFLSILRVIIGSIYYLLVRLIGIAFIPFLFVDSFMAYFGFKSGYVSPKNRTFIRYIVDYIRVGFEAITRESIGRKDLKKRFVVFLSCCFKNSKIIPNRVTFLSNRRDDLSGNFEYIYDVLKNDASLDIVLHLDPNPMHRMSFLSLYKFSKLYATSAVVVIDDFYELTSMVPKRDEVKLVQVWHACGAFKTFGFSRLGKPGGPKQGNSNHRMYDRAIVSSEEIRRFYAEGFGISLSSVAATGVPRTDMFFDPAVKARISAEFYEKYPALKRRKIVLFAPTFRGNGRLSGYYPMEKFDLAKVYEELNGDSDDYALLVKMHPFVNNPIEIPEKYKDFIINFSEDSELNDLLFVTDVLITDYSSVVFEASLLDIPMLFYAYDLSEYIASRDFYYEYESFLPGKLVLSQQDIVNSIKSRDFETEKISAFRSKFFDHLDGKSSERVADMIKGLL